MKTRKRLLYVFLITAISLLATPAITLSSQNPFETRKLNSYVGKWGNSKAKTILFLYPASKNGMQGTITRDKASLTIKANFAQGALDGRMFKGTQSFPIAIVNDGKKVHLTSGTWKATLYRYKERTFAGQYKKDTFEIELQKTAEGKYIGGIKMNGAVYIIDAQSKFSLLWGRFSKDTQSWPFFAHWTGDERLDFHTGNHIERSISYETPKLQRIAAQKEAEQKRLTAERKRIAAKKEAERKRVAAEKKRIAAEKKRMAAERERRAAERKAALKIQKKYLAEIRSQKKKLEQEKTPVLLKIPVCFPTSLEVLGSSATEFADKVNNSSDSIHVKVYEPGKLVTTSEILNSVSRGEVNAGYSVSAFWEGEMPGISLFSGAMPFGASARDHYDWIMNRGGLERYQNVYDQAGFNVKVIPVGLMGPEGFGWFKNPLYSADDLKGLRMRFFGSGGTVMKKLGASIFYTPGKDLLQALAKKTIDATEFSLPYIDRRIQFQKECKYYYYPGWHQRTTMFDLLINRNTWDNMSSSKQDLILRKAHETALWGIEEEERRTLPALAQYKDEGVTIATVPDSIVDAAHGAWKQLVSEIENESSLFKENYADYRKHFPAQRVLFELKTGR